jgi:signal transduction histidine kinase
MLSLIRKIILIFVFIFSVFIIRANVTEMPLTKNGILDLQKWDFKSDNIIEIGGDAKFYWNEILSINDIQNNSSDYNLISLNRSWNNQSNEHINYSALGYGTYHFKMVINKDDVGKQFMIRPNHFIAYASQIFVNNKQVSHNGYVGVSEKDKKYDPRRNTISSSFVADSTVLDVIIWASNFSHFRGGIFQKLKFGSVDEMIDHREKEVTYDLFVIISLLIMFFYHIILFFVNKRDRIALFFSLTCLIFAFDLSFQDTMTFFIFFPNVSFSLSSFLQLSMPFLLPSSFIFFLHELFPNELPKGVRNFAGILSLLLIGLTLLNNHVINGFIAKPHYVYSFIVVFYVYVVSVKAMLRKREGARLFLLAYSIFSICAINDILFVFEVIYTVHLVSTGLIIFVFLLSILQGRRTANISNRNIKLANHLKDLNINLESKVDERTKELNESLEKIHKLNQFKEDMTNMIIHDLKTPLSTIINAKLLKDTKIGRSLIQQSGYRMLNLVQNVLDVYKYKNAEIELSKRKVELRQVLDKAIEEIDFSAKERLLDITISNDFKFVINVDLEIIRRVFVNLLTNAVKYSPVNGIIDIDAKVNEENLLKVSIHNQGKGIPKERQEQIFEKFGQAEQKSKQGSTGLGLTFCKMAIEAHKGEIGVISELDDGVEFWFTLPDSYQGDMKDHLANQSSIKVSLTDEEIEYLIPFINEIKEFQSYQITTINNVLAKIERKSKNIETWIDDLTEALYSGDEFKHNSLINF